MKNFRTKQLVMDALLLSLLVVSAYINIIVVIPITLQLFVVFFIIVLCNWQDALIITGLYFIMGFLGMPVFAGATSGITPTTGFVIGFVFACLPMAYLKKKRICRSELIEDLIYCFVALIIVYICGFGFYMIYMKISFQETFVIFLVFIGIDIGKCILGGILAYKIQIILDDLQGL